MAVRGAAATFQAGAHQPQAAWVVGRGRMEAGNGVSVVVVHVIEAAVARLLLWPAHMRVLHPHCPVLTIRFRSGLNVGASYFMRPPHVNVRPLVMMARSLAT